ncbi:MAG: prepilin-type N-terminal cleavage/methylation domain-containing protein [Clostridium sp.]|nr:prepilin-type N-terminal cleavage/methylation domain-containing protein [Clostridium sp.]
MKKSNNGGFSLVEVVIVVAIMAVLSAIAITAFLTLVERAKLRADDTQAANIKRTLSAYIIESNDVKVQELLLEGSDGANDVEKILIALQKQINGKYGPYLQGATDPSVGVKDFSPKGRNRGGWLITIDEETMAVSVEPTASSDELKFIP